MSSHFPGAIRRLAVLVALILAITLVTTAGAWAEGGSTTPSAEGQSPSASGPVTFTIGTTNNPTTLNPNMGWEVTDYALYDLVYDGLVTQDNATLQPKPALAESWELSPDAKVWTFHIRKGVTWHDGEPLTAQDVVFSYDFYIKNEVGNWADAMNGIKKVVATDDYTVQLTCERPVLNVLTSWAPILPAHIWSKVSPEDATNSFKNGPPMIGSGPFQVTVWKRNAYVKLVANKDYWAGAPHIDELEYLIYTNEDTLATDLENGTIDFTTSLAPARFKKFQSTPGFTAETTEFCEWRGLGINCYEGPSLGNPVLRDPAFRRALSYAIDRAACVQVAWQGYGVPGDQLLPSGYYSAPDYHWTPPADVQQNFDLEKAKALLDEAGYRDTNGDGIREDKKGEPIKLRLWAVNDEPAYQPCGKLVATWWKDIGLKIDFAVYDPDTVTDREFNYNADGQLCPDYDVYVWGWEGTYDPNFILNVFRGSQIENWNDSGWSNPEYDKLYDEESSAVDPATGAIDGEKRKELVWKMQEIFYDQAPNIIIVYNQGLAVYNSKWEGFFRTPAETGVFTDRWVWTSVKLKQGATAESGGSNTNLIVGIIAAVVIVSVAAVVIYRRRAGRQEEVA